MQIDVLGIAKHKLNGRSHRAKGSANDVIYMLDSAMLDSVPMYPKPTHDNTLTSHTHSFSDMHTQVRELRLLPSDRRLQFLQKLRDEAHRYAISFHRSQKLKKLTQIQLLGTQKNLSVAQIDKLLRIYGDFAHIRDLTPEQITQALRQNTKGNKNV